MIFLYTLFFIMFADGTMVVLIGTQQKKDLENLESQGVTWFEKVTENLAHMCYPTWDEQESITSGSLLFAEIFTLEGDNLTR